MRLRYCLFLLLIAVLASCAKDEPESIYDTYTAEIHAVQGNYSVSATQQVQFARGNVQYQPLTGHWRIAPEQYRYKGICNEYTSALNIDFYDLFGWGTGSNPTLRTVDTNDYAEYTEWGSNFGPEWRTLNWDEWEYLLYYRTNAAKLYTTATVCGEKGLMLLPDNWTSLTSIAVVPAAYSDTNQYDAEQWKILERYGAVFLPTTGYRNGDDYYAGNFSYWSSSSVAFPGWEGQRVFLALDLEKKSVELKGISAYCGLAVRLCRDVQ